MTTNKKFIATAFGTMATIAAVTFAFKRTKENSHSNDHDDDESDEKIEVYKRAPEIYYKPDDPSEISTYDYLSNPTVFGKILRGELPARVLLETQDWFVFEDISPRAPLHALIIPKRRIRSVLEFTASDLSLLKELNELANRLVMEHLPLAYHKGDFKLCFHIPPLNTVDHLHLHVLAPASQMSLLAKSEFHTSLENSNHQTMRWNILLSEVMKRLEQGLPPTPFDKDYRWTSVLHDTLSSLRTLIFSGKASATVP